MLNHDAGPSPTTTFTSFPRIVSLTAIPIRNPIIFFYIPHSCLRFVLLSYLLYYTALYNSKFCSKYARPLNPLDLVWSHLASIPPTLRQKNDEILIADTFLISNILQKDVSLSSGAYYTGRSTGCRQGHADRTLDEAVS